MRRGTSVLFEPETGFMERAVQLALAAEARGNLAIGALITLATDGHSEVIGEGQNAILRPHHDPGRHAEVEAIRSIRHELWPRARAMTCYTTLEPCVMCMGTLLLHGVRRVVFGARDSEGGASHVLAYLPPYYRNGPQQPAMEWVGPVLPDRCDELYQRARDRFKHLPCAIWQQHK